MDHISFRCSTCDHSLKVSAEKAGRKVKCSRCNALLTVPDATPAKEEVAAATAAKKNDDDDDDKGGYGLLIDPQEAAEKKRREEEERRRKKEKAKKDAAGPAPIKRRVKTIYDAPDWKKVNVGIVIVLCALALWGLQFLLQEITVLIGVIKGPQYSILVERVLMVPIPEDERGDWPKPGRMMPNDRMGFMMALVSGYDFRTVGKVLLLLGQVFLLVMGGMFLTAYGFFRNIPDRFGVRALLKGMMVLGSINLFFGVFTKLLPMATNFGPCCIPLVLPEVAMTGANVERTLPLHVFWMNAPFWETLLTLIVQLCFYVELMLIGVFIWTAGKILQEEYVEGVGRVLSQLAGGVYFISFAYVMLSIAGTSDVLVAVLRVIYVLWMGFFIGYLLYFAISFNNLRQMIDKLVTDSLAEERATGKKKRSEGLGGEEEEEEEDEDERDRDDDEDEDDRDRRARGRAQRRKRDEDDDDYERDDDDDDD